MNEQQKQRLEDVYAHHAKSLYFYLLKMTGSPQIAEDLVQETFVRATVSLSFYKQEQVKAWLFKVARHAYLDLWRKRQKWKWVPFYDVLNQHPITNPNGEPEAALLKQEARIEIDQLMDALPETYRTALYLRETLELSYKEIGETMDQNENQVKVTLHRARQRMKQLNDERNVER
ncbi:sigma-70 family RNA polymerase sigma factor [Thalassobacillus sp. CUG 92003]|uniref:sigma-70 family RNA polymerase sigma factor n=1 Tax=Thalassobacillus sp. CUG 92003 TaxID=2736641 RepID=UPI0015E7E1E9